MNIWQKLLMVLLVTAMASACGQRKKQPTADDGNGHNTPDTNVVEGPNGTNNAASNGTANNNSGDPAPSVSEQIHAAAELGAQFMLGCYGRPIQDGGWGPDVPFVGLNALVLCGLMRSAAPVGPENDKVRATLEALIGQQQRDGAWFSPQNGTAVYETAATVRALVAAVQLDPTLQADEEWIGAIRKGRDYLLLSQIDENPEVDESGNPVEAAVSEGDEEYGAFYGGWGYGRAWNMAKAPSNMSTTNFAMEALEETTEVLPHSDEVEAAQQKLRNFLRHCHNLREYNGQPYNTEPLDPHWNGEPEQTQPGNDGGAQYSPGTSKAGYTEGQNGILVPTSYGSMTYALLRLYHMSGIDASDPRIQKAFEWVTRAENFTFEVNPGFPPDGTQEYHGLLYYIWTAAHTMDRLTNSDTITDSRGEEHNWRETIAMRLLELQQESGMWVNPGSARWQEQVPLIATSYMMIATRYLD